MKDIFGGDIVRPRNGRRNGTGAHLPGATAGAESGARPLASGSYLTAVTIIGEDLANILDGKKLEFNDMTGNAELGRVPVTDVDVSTIRAEIERRIDGPRKGTGIRVKDIDVHKAIDQVARRNAYHPVREYLEPLVWDGTSRLAELPRVVGAGDPRLATVVMRRWCISAVARGMKPGMKVDTVLVLVGEQALFKSSFFAEIVPDQCLFSDSVIAIGSRDAYNTIRGLWILEWAELDSLRRARDAETVKAFLSARKDTFRPAFGRRDIVCQRTCIVVGTTNHVQFLSDDTGNRRFWPVVVTSKADLAWVRLHRDQIWAEATAAWAKGEQWWLTPEEEQDLKVAQKEHEISDAWAQPVLDYVNGRTRVTIGEVLTHAIQKPTGQWTPSEEQRVGKILRLAGWSQSRSSGGPRFWRPPRSIGTSAGPSQGPSASATEVHRGPSDSAYSFSFSEIRDSTCTTGEDPVVPMDPMDLGPCSAEGDRPGPSDGSRAGTAPAYAGTEPSALGRQPGEDDDA